MFLGLYPPSSLTGLICWVSSLLSGPHRSKLSIAYSRELQAWAPSALPYVSLQFPQGTSKWSCLRQNSPPSHANNTLCFLSLYMTVTHLAPKLPHLLPPGSRPSQFYIILQITLFTLPQQSSHLEGPAVVYLLVLLPKLQSHDLLCTLP